MIHASDGSREAWALEDESRRVVGLGPLTAWTIVPVGVLVATTCLLGPLGFVAVLVVLLTTSVDPSRRAGRLLRYRRVLVDGAGLQVDWLDELDRPPRGDQLLDSRGRRPQRVRWEDVSAIERVGLGTVRITERDGRARELTRLDAEAARTLEERLREIWQRVREGAPSAAQSAERRSQVERLLGERHRDG